MKKAKDWFNHLTKEGLNNLMYYYGSSKSVKTDDEILEFYNFCSDSSNIMPVNDY